MILSKSFFQRNALTVAKELLGKYLAVKSGGKLIKRMITEVEAYDGPDDMASHAARGRTERNKIMYKEGGIWYVYFVYGMHYMLNIVTGKKNYPAAILIRSVEGINGPGKLTKMFNINFRFNGKSAAARTGLYVIDSGVKINPKKIKSGPRVGVSYAGPIWSKKKYRFFLKC